jgi:alpha 1,3-glucosidase
MFLLNFLAEYDPVNGPHPLDFPYDGPNFWEESFGSHSDTKPKGPSGIAMDFSFHGSEHVYGLPEHATSLSLKNTIGENAQYSQPYRLYNLDVFEFELNEPMSLYGAIPFLMSHATAKRDVAVFWLNAAETFIDISSVHDANGAPRKDAHFISESGMLDFFILTGRAPSDLFAHYAALTGHASMPQMFAIAYHQV